MQSSIYNSLDKQVKKKKRRENRQVPSASCWDSPSLALVTGATGLSQPCLLQALNMKYSQWELLNRKTQLSNQDSPAPD